MFLIAITFSFRAFLCFFGCVAVLLGIADAFGIILYHTLLVVIVEDTILSARANVYGESFMAQFSVADTDEIAIFVCWIFQQLTMVQTLFQCLARRPIGGTFTTIWIVGFIIVTFVYGVLATECASHVFLAIDWMRITAQAWTFPTFDDRAAGVGII